MLPFAHVHYMRSPLSLQILYLGVSQRIFLLFLILHLIDHIVIFNFDSIITVPTAPMADIAAALTVSGGDSHDIMILLHIIFMTLVVSPLIQSVEAHGVRFAHLCCLVAGHH